jgi:hypothetical protein
MNPLQHVLFLDVETVSQHPELAHVDDRGQALWKQKIGFMARRDVREWEEEHYEISYKERAAIYAEFGKVIVISAGILTMAENQIQNLRIKSFYGDDEKEVLGAFDAVLQKNFNDPNMHMLCGHNIREFDIPYLCRRFTVHGMSLPPLLNIAGKKPWEVKYVCDTLELWKFGDHKNYTSLDLLAFTLGIPSPKENLDGSKVGHTYWVDGELEKIKEYCERDVVTVTQVYLRLNNRELLRDDQVVLTN